MHSANAHDRRRPQQTKASRCDLILTYIILKPVSRSRLMVVDVVYARALLHRVASLQTTFQRTFMFNGQWLLLSLRQYHQFFLLKVCSRFGEQ